MTQQLWQLTANATIKLVADDRFCLTNMNDIRREGNPIVLWRCDLASLESQQRWIFKNDGLIQLAQHLDWCLDGGATLSLMPCWQSSDGIVNDVSR